jgi:hypothetical protein
MKEAVHGVGLELKRSSRDRDPQFHSVLITAVLEANGAGASAVIGRIEEPRRLAPDIEAVPLDRCDFELVRRWLVDLALKPDTNILSAGSRQMNAITIGSLPSSTTCSSVDGSSSSADRHPAGTTKR